MKVRSLVLTHVQYPVTLLGVPAPLLALSAGTGVLLFLTFFSARIPEMSLLSFLVVLGGGYSAAYRLTRRDPHAFEAFRAREPFRKFGRKNRLLVAGRKEAA